MRRKRYESEHLAKRTDNPDLPKTAHINLRPGDHVVLLVKQLKGLSDWPASLVRKEYIFVKKYPHHYSFVGLNGFRESFLEQELSQIMV